MSADNYLAIREEDDGKWRIYMESASDEEAPRFDGRCWGESTSLDGAIRGANKICREEIVEYGYEVFGLKGE